MEPAAPMVTWRRSNACGDGASCVEVAQLSSTVLVRDSRATVANFRDVTWQMFMRDVRRHKLPTSKAVGLPPVRKRPNLVLQLQIVIFMSGMRHVVGNGWLAIAPGGGDARRTS
ncbi:DUF397 domain-containing protein [Streptomyces sp. NPDC102340]|uniref:DUF397 domain-containing protein n=1 Tax=unclassified Streptomyces TaxID=2593676 RepID=UPI0037F87965